MSNTKILLGRKIRLLRKSRGWTQDYLSEKIGINPKSILRIENGQTFPSIQNLEKISEIFEIEIADLFNNQNLDDINILRRQISDMIPKLDDAGIRSLHNFLCAINHA